MKKVDAILSLSLMTKSHYVRKWHHSLNLSLAITWRVITLHSLNKNNSEQCCNFQPLIRLFTATACQILQMFNSLLVVNLMLYHLCIVFFFCHVYLLFSLFLSFSNQQLVRFTFMYSLNLKNFTLVVLCNFASC